MKKTDERSLINKGTDSSKDIEENFPKFYQANKERIDNGKIKFFEEPWAIEGGVLIDMETLETLFVDFRS